MPAASFCSQTTPLDNLPLYRADSRGSCILFCHSLQLSCPQQPFLYLAEGWQYCFRPLLERFRQDCLVRNKQHSHACCTGTCSAVFRVLDSIGFFRFAVQFFAGSQIDFWIGLAMLNFIPRDNYRKIVCESR